MRYTILIAIAFILGLLCLPLINLHACAMTAVISNGTHLLSDENTGLPDYQKF